MNMNFVLAAESMEMVKDWPTIAGNTISALKIMGMGLLAIFIVIGIIILAVTILNKIDKKVADKKNAVAVVETAKAPAIVSAPATPVPQAVESAATPVAEASAEETVTMDDIEEPKYRKGVDMSADPKYRKSDED